jgi:2,3-dihydroxyphenylpropionate 1,2-dioxygenase
MLTGIDATDQSAQGAFFAGLERLSRELDAFSPDLVVVFGPDHFNGFFYDLLPSFCIGAAAESTRDWHLEPGRLNVPQDLALALVRQLHRSDIDAAISWHMKVDHGITIPLFKIAGTLDRYNVLPVFINCAADPRPSFRRVRVFGSEIGRFLAQTGLKVAVVGSGGLSHDPPTPRLATAPAEVAQRLIHRHTPTQAELDRREAHVMSMARALVAGGGACKPPNEPWDRAFLDRLLAGRDQELDRIDDAELDREAGFGGHEVRTWVAAAAAARAMGNLDMELVYYRPIPEWITGMAIVAGRERQAAPSREPRQ